MVDDFFFNDDLFGGGGGGGGGQLLYYIEGFIDTRDLGPPIYADASAPDEYAAGNVNLYSDTMLWEVSSIGASALIGLVQGTCTRTDPNDVLDPAYEGRGHCSFTFEALAGTDVVASFAAEGPVMNGASGNSTILAIKGGLGQFAGISGEVYLDTAFLDFSTTPPVAVYDPSIDFLASPDGYLMYGYIYSDVRIDLLEDDIFGFDDTIFGDDAILGDDTFFGDDALVGDDAFVADDDPFFGTLAPTPAGSGAGTPAGSGAATEGGTPSPSAGGTASTTAGDTSGASLGGSATEPIFCPDQPEDDFCDCASDCVNFPDTRCSCEAAQQCCNLV